MNRKEWLENGRTVNRQRNYITKLLKQWKLDNNISGRCVVHHRDDTEETRKYNEEHYELWGFNEDGTFEYGKYIVFMTHREHASYHNSRITRSVEQRKRISDSLIGRFAGENHPLYGKHHTEESRKRMSESHKGKTLSKEARDKISKSNKGTVRTETHKAAYRAARQKFSALYAEYKENGGTLKWNDFCHAVSCGEIEIKDKETDNGKA